MSAYFLKLYFKSPVRVGMPGRDEQATRESLPADQIFSWLSLGWIKAFGVEDYTDSVASPFLSGEPPWEHSDLFPTTGMQVWLPAPRWQVGEGSGQTTATDKKMRTPWVDWDSFFRALRESVPPVQSNYGMPLQVQMQNNVRIRRGDEKDNDPFYTASVQRRREQDRSKGGSDSSDLTVFTGLLRCADKKMLARVESVLRLMADEGFGGNRSSGLGAIAKCSVTEVDGGKQELHGKQGASRYVILSPCYPSEQMLRALSTSAEGSNCYTLTSRGGWIYDSSGRATDIRKATTYLFDSGSCFSVKPQGRLVDVGRHGKTSYRYGIPFVVEA